MSGSPATPGPRPEPDDGQTHDGDVESDQSESQVASQAVDSDVDYWTSERMKSATPMDVRRDRPA
ncbi:MAG: hypothetical protein L0G99_17015, partial [Propionibacteriales bacterium]|nr:hypothetical protein [Propionibacteriales bacterium]